MKAKSIKGKSPGEMTSLGELTAGIAHYIQDPLNSN